ncbi:hypothetical protein [Paraburkholderia sp. DGU8]|uniref:hypothetical protein n=1 Tax=Paraburkholderia sp. DGU8 TaxID=3161997 RepID=UPI0034677FDF
MTALQRATAQQIGATVVKVHASHMPMLSKPIEVAAAIIDAARVVRKQKPTSRAKGRAEQKASPRKPWRRFSASALKGRSGELAADRHRTPTRKVTSGTGGQSPSGRKL